MEWYLGPTRPRRCSLLLLSIRLHLQKAELLIGPQRGLWSGKGLDLGIHHPCRLCLTVRLSCAMLLCCSTRISDWLDKFLPTQWHCRCWCIGPASELAGVRTSFSLYEDIGILHRCGILTSHWLHKFLPARWGWNCCIDASYGLAIGCKFSLLHGQIGRLQMLPSYGLHETMQESHQWCMIFTQTHIADMSDWLGLMSFAQVLNWKMYMLSL